MLEIDQRNPGLTGIDPSPDSSLAGLAGIAHRDARLSDNLSADKDAGKTFFLLPPHYTRCDNTVNQCGLGLLANGLRR